jgi:hypothetical protein
MSKIKVDQEGVEFDPTKTYVVGATPYPGNILDFPEALASLNLVEVELPEIPADVTDKTHIISRWNMAPYLAWTPRDPRQIILGANNDIWNKIDALERQKQWPRALRELILGVPTHPAYVKIKEFDDLIEQMKAGLVDVPVENIL